MINVRVLKNLIAVVTAITALLGLSALILTFFGYRPFILKTQSMEPMYRQGSLCWVDTRASLESLEIGDALVYRSPANSLVLHRLVDIQESDSSTSIAAVMRGDANDLTQNVELSHINYIGREAFTIPNLGLIVEQIHNIAWIAVGLFIVLACIPWESIKRNHHDGLQQSD